MKKESAWMFTTFIAAIVFAGSHMWEYVIAMVFVFVSIWVLGD